MHATSPEEGLATRHAAAEAIQTERSRTNPGFGDLPSVASTVLPQIQQVQTPSQLHTINPQPESRQLTQTPQVQPAQRTAEAAVTRPAIANVQIQRPTAAPQLVHRQIPMQPQIQPIQNRPADGPAVQPAAHHPPPSKSPPSSTFQTLAPGKMALKGSRKIQTNPRVFPPSLHPAAGFRRRIWQSYADVCRTSRTFQMIFSLTLPWRPSFNSIRQPLRPSHQTCKWRCMRQRRHSSPSTTQLLRTRGSKWPKTWRCLGRILCTSRRVMMTGFLAA